MICLHLNLERSLGGSPGKRGLTDRGSGAGTCGSRSSSP